MAEMLGIENIHSQHFGSSHWWPELQLNYNTITGFKDEWIPFAKHLKFPLTCGGGFSVGWSEKVSFSWDKVNG